MNRPPKWVASGLVLCAVLTTFSTQAADRFWLGSSTSNFNDAANWSATSGGSSGASVPGSSDVAYFDGSSSGNCDLNVNVNVKGLHLESTYLYSVIQAANTVNIGSNGLIIEGGTFTGGSAQIDVVGDVIQNAGNFTSTTDRLLCRQDADFAGGSFFANSGTVQFHSSNDQLSGTATFHILKLSTPTHTVINQNGSLFDYTVTQELHWLGSRQLRLDAGTIHLQGDLIIGNTYAGAGSGGTAVISIEGTGNQLIDGSSARLKGGLCLVRIDKPSGDLNLQEYITCKSGFDYQQGNVVPGTASNDCVILWTMQTVSGNPTLHNVEIFGGTANSDVIIPVGETLTVNGTLLYSGTTRAAFLNGTVAANGDVIITNSSTSSNNTSTLLFGGGADQTLTGPAAVNQGVLGFVEIDKPDGILTLSGDVYLSQDWTYRRGLIDPTASDFHHQHTAGADVILPPTEGFAADWINEVAATVAGSQLSKTGVSPGWNAGAETSNELPVADDGWIQYIADGTTENKAIGFAPINLGTVDISDLEYGIQLTDLGQVKAMRSGVDNIVESYVANDVIRVWKRLGEVLFVHNGYIQDRETVTAAAIWKGWGIIHSVGGTLHEVRCSFPRKIDLTNYPVAELNKRLDGGYFSVKDGLLRFRYDEQYNDQDNALTWRIRNQSNDVVADVNDLNVPIVYGDNRTLLDLTCDGLGLNGGMYVLEVENEKRETWLLRFKQETNYTCNGNGNQQGN